jgi:hypothetical protein
MLTGALRLLLCPLRELEAKTWPVILPRRLREAEPAQALHVACAG